jgi:ACS family glucarate transporter-like MFS transporter
VENRSRQTAAGVLPALWTFAFLSYLLRTNIAVAQQYMGRELSLSDIEIGYVFSAFLIGYTIFQLPAGVLGDKFGPRAVLAASALICGAATLCTGFVPGLLLKGTFLAMGSLLLIRFVLGLGQAATYPVAMTAVGDWFPASRHASVNSLIFTGSTLGAAFAPPLVAYIMSALGWRATFYWTGITPILLAAWWLLQTRGLAHHEGGGSTKLARQGTGWWRLILQKNVLVLCVSYFLYCYAISIFVYWLFKYLVEVRHLSIVNSGWANSLPWIAATVVVPLLGRWSDRLSALRGALSGRRRMATSCLTISALLMFVGAGAENITVAIVAIALSVSLLFSTEASYWSTAIAVAKGDAGTAGGLMNLAGNLGGVFSTTLVPILAHSFGWFRALLSGSAFAVAATLFWFLIREENSEAGPETFIEVERRPAASR